MRPRLSAILYATAIVLGLSGAAAAQSNSSSTTDSGTAAALETQTAQMDALAVSRGETQVTSRTADTFTAFAGSRENAVSLVTGLRKGSEITLTDSTSDSASSSSTTFTPVTKPMGNGNAFNSLALAQQRLASEGITEPTPQQIEAALNGGEITIGEGADAKTVQLDGVLQMRADGMGWGQIAQAQGTKLGYVVGALRSANASIAKQSKGGTTTTASGSEGSGITTAAGGRTAAGKYSEDANGKGVVNGANQSASSSGASRSSHGIQNAMGGSAGSGNGNAYGRTKSHGIVTATGASAGGSSANAGIVSAGGSSGAGSANAASRGNGIVGAGGGQGHGNAYGRAK